VTGFERKTQGKEVRMGKEVRRGKERQRREIGTVGMREDKRSEMENADSCLT